jgi:pyroglutamyl-peptidase
MKPEPLVLLTGFGPFETFAANPSALVAERVAAAPPPGLRVRASVLPVSFERAPSAWDAALEEAGAPALLLALGVAQEPGFRFERHGGPRLKVVPRPDVDGRSAGEFSRPGPPLVTRVAVDDLVARLRARGVADAFVSESAGGYVCERIYHHVLARGAALGVPGLFLHLPPESETPIERQAEVVGWVLEELVAAGGANGQPSSSMRG